MNTRFKFSTLGAMTLLVFAAAACATSGSGSDGAALDQPKNTENKPPGDGSRPEGPPRSPLEAAERWAMAPPSDVSADVQQALNKNRTDQRASIERVIRIAPETYHAVLASDSKDAVELVIKRGDSGGWRVVESRIRDAREYWPGIRK